MAEQRRIVGKERPASHYDESNINSPSTRVHYTRTEYYGLWATILDRLRFQQRRRILEIGCGSGQLANAIRDMELAEAYLGVDFSTVAIEQARKFNPSWDFRCADVFEDRALEDFDYDIVISTEFLEHIEADLSIVGRIRPGTIVMASVPNFPWHSHVRHFKNAQEVYDRYRGFFERLLVVPVRMQEKFAVHFLMQGKRGDPISSR